MRRAYPRQNSLHTALREIGRIERSLFMLEWMKDPELRRRVQVGLNKGEARNALARAVFFNRQGDLRDRSFENQRYRASGLNLIVAAIVLWNTVYLERAITADVWCGDPVKNKQRQRLPDKSAGRSRALAIGVKSWQNRAERPLPVPEGCSGIPSPH
jgi:TnpA family transposase